VNWESCNLANGKAGNGNTQFNHMMLNQSPSINKQYIITNLNASLSYVLCAEQQSVYWAICGSSSLAVSVLVDLCQPSFRQHGQPFVLRSIFEGMYQKYNSLQNVDMLMTAWFDTICFPSIIRPDDGHIWRNNYRLNKYLIIVVLDGIIKYLQPSDINTTGWTSRSII
jgi:hypothetical protein